MTKKSDGNFQVALLCNSDMLSMKRTLENMTLLNTITWDLMRLRHLPNLCICILHLPESDPVMKICQLLYDLERILETLVITSSELVLLTHAKKVEYFSENPEGLMV